MSLNRSTPPQSSTLSKVAFPSFIVGELDSGAPVYIVENHAQPLVSMSLYVKAGSAQNNPVLPGQASLMAEMLTKGTTSRTAPEIADKIDFLGASLGSIAGWDATTVSTSTLTRYLPEVIELLVDVTRAPRFSDEELERICIQRLAGIRHAKSDPSYLADAVFAKQIFSEHPYSQEPGGTEASISAITSSDLKQFHSQYFYCGNAFFIIAGDVYPDDIIEALNTYFHDWGVNSIATSANQGVKISHAGVHLVTKPQAVQSALRIGHSGIDRTHKDFTKCSVLNTLLGGYFGSRINANLRERNGYTYGARSFFDARKQSGAFAVSTEVRTEVTSAAVQEILNEMDRICTEKVAEKELRMVKNYIIGSFPLSIETAQQVAGRLSLIPLYGVASNYYDTFRSEVEQLTPTELLDTAQTYLHPDAVTIVASGDTDALCETMCRFGEVSIYDKNFIKTA